MLLLLLLFWDYKVYIALLLAFLVVLARANLSTFPGLTVSVLEAPVSNLEVASLSVLLHIVIFIVIFDHIIRELLEIL